MKPPPDPQLEPFIDRKLRALPDLVAPPTLAPRVLAAIRARAQAWWRQAWWHWPLPAKAAFVVASIALVALVGGGGMVLNQNVSAFSQQLSQRLPQTPDFAATVQSLAQQAYAYAGTLHQTVWIALAAGLALLYLLCIGLGSALFRFVLNHPSNHPL